MSIFLSGNNKAQVTLEGEVETPTNDKHPAEVTLVQSVILIVVYIVHIILMKLNHKYEVFIKRAVANFLEVRELNRLATEGISHFHFNLDSRILPIEILNKINYRQEGDILIFDEPNQKQFKEVMQLKGQFMAK